LTTHADVVRGVPVGPVPEAVGGNQHSAPAPAPELSNLPDDMDLDDMNAQDSDSASVTGDDTDDCSASSQTDDVQDTDDGGINEFGGTATSSVSAVSIVCCLLFVVCCLLFVVCCLLFVVCCLLFVVCCLLFVVCC
jgi:hypothetical protein